MGTIVESNPRAKWRQRYRRATFKGVPFHVEQQSRTSGMRTVVHEYPKRDLPYAEIMGRHATRYQVTGYIIQSSRNDYQAEKERLILALDEPEPGDLYDPYRPDKPLKCVCERYSVAESRERGGYCTFDMQFVELGSPANVPQPNTAQQTTNQANTTATTGANTLNNAAAQAASNANSGSQGTPTPTPVPTNVVTGLPPLPPSLFSW